MPSTLKARAVWQGGMAFQVQAGAHSLITDYPLEPGDAGEGPRPLELLLASLVSCLGGCLAMLLRKQGQDFEALELAVDGLRRDEHPTVVEGAVIRVTVKGRDLDEAVVHLALSVSESRFCPVWAMLQPGLAVGVELNLVQTAQP